MLGVVAPVWNQVALKGETVSQWGQEYFPMDQEELNQAMDEEMTRLEQQGVTPKVVLAYLTVAPLLAEREGIMMAVKKEPALRNVLPEVNSVQEAVTLASRDRMLTTSEQDELTKLLETEPKLQPMDHPWIPPQKPEYGKLRRIK